MKPITNKGLFWELRNSIWTLWTFFPFGFFNYISFFYIAARLKDKKLFMYGVLYAIPFINIMAMDSVENPSTGYENVSYMTMLVVWIISIVHVMKVRRRYLLSKADVVSYTDKLAEENLQLQRKLQALTSTDHEPKAATVASEASVKVAETIPKIVAAPLDVNIATETELAAIAEIGPLLAGKIIVERQQIGRFESFEQFTQVMEFKPHIAHKFKQYVTVTASEASQAPTQSQKGRVIDY